MSDRFYSVGLKGFKPFYHTDFLPLAYRLFYYLKRMGYERAMIHCNIMKDAKYDTAIYTIDDAQDAMERYYKYVDFEVNGRNVGKCGTP